VSARHGKREDDGSEPHSGGNGMHDGAKFQ
jgi:hypothetical protein